MLLHWLHIAESIRLSVGPSVCPIGILTVTHQGAACDADTVHFELTARRNDILVHFCTSCTVPGKRGPQLDRIFSGLAEMCSRTASSRPRRPKFVLELEDSPREPNPEGLVSASGVKLMQLDGDSMTESGT